MRLCMRGSQIRILLWSLGKIDIARSAAGPRMPQGFKSEFSKIFAQAGWPIVDVPHDCARQHAHGHGGRDARTTAQIVQTFEQPDALTLLECVARTVRLGNIAAARYNRCSGIPREQLSAVSFAKCPQRKQESEWLEPI